MLPVVHSFACFLSARPNEQIYNQCSEGSKVIYVGSLAGLLPGGPGHSHQSVRDIAALGSVPDLVLAEPALEAEVRALFDHFVSVGDDSAYLRLVSVKWPVPFSYPRRTASPARHGWVVREGADVVVFGYGPWLLSNAWHAAEELERGWPEHAAHQPAVVESRRSRMASRGHWIHAGRRDARQSLRSWRSGRDGRRSHRRARAGSARRRVMIGVTELPVCGTNDEVLAYHGLDVTSIAKSIRTAVQSRRPVASQLA